MPYITIAIMIFQVIALGYQIRVLLGMMRIRRYMKDHGGRVENPSDSDSRHALRD